MALTQAKLRRADVDRVVASALAEDVGSGDVTSEGLVDADAVCEAAILVKEPGVVCGLPVAEAVFHALDPRVSFETLHADGDRLDDAAPVARLQGSARAILTGERTALNVLGRLSGIATLTRRFVDEAEGTSAQVLDTRKTTPGLRGLEKYAVACGGGRNHRFGLYDGILIKDNHLRLAGSIGAAVASVRRVAAPELPVEVEAETLDDVRDALAAQVDVVLLDNMSTALLAESVKLVSGRAQLEASGGVTLANLREVAETGVDFVSIGALTHSARSLDVSLEVR
jgi:nicotinate-nucleotide pyrophosphorylase (carboxylating)